MTDNRQTREAAFVREKSAFVKSAEDFARFQYKEYVEQSDDYAMLICAVDRTVGDGEAAAANIVIGRQALMTSAIADMMKQDGIGEMFRRARIIGAVAKDDDMKAELARQRRRLRYAYAMLALVVLWLALNVAMMMAGTSEWHIAVTNLLLIAFVISVIWHDVSDRRRKVASLSRELDEERHQRARMRQEAVVDLLKRAARGDFDEDEYDDDKD